VERVPLIGPAGARASSALRLTFDVGVVTLRPGEEGRDFEVQLEGVPDAGSEVFVSASEEDPWWRVMGSPLTRVQARAAGGVWVQFREDRENPRRFVVFLKYGGIEASVDD
jgi:hypothetical protein